MAGALYLWFGGWFQCRLAIDPDPYDEPYGLRGATTVLPGEPPFDRVIRTTGAGAVVRDECPAIGLRVLDASPAAHPVFQALRDARVSLEPGTDPDGHGCGGPFFQGWNGLIAKSGNEPISVIDLKIVADHKAWLRRRRSALLAYPDAALAWDRPLPPEWAALRDRFPLCKTLEPLGDVVQRRQVLLDRKRAAPPVSRQAQVLASRLAMLDLTQSMAGNPAIPVAQGYCVDLDAPGTVGESLRPYVDPGGPWTLRLAFTAFDYDALSGVLAGSLTLPILA